MGQRLPAETDEEDLAELMVGRDVQLTVDRGESHPGETRLSVNGLRVNDDRGSGGRQRGRPRGARGRESWASRASPATGRTSSSRPSSGCAADRRDASCSTARTSRQLAPRACNEAGVGFVPADRHRFGLVLSFPLADNLVLTSYHRAPYARGVSCGTTRRSTPSARELVEEFDVRTPSATVRAGTLSGGNQQKVIVAREFSGDPTLLVLDQPTRGLDVGSVESIHRLVIAKRDAGTAVLLVSAELDEVLELSDRIAVMYRGAHRRRA